MSETTTTTSGNVFLLFPDKPGYYTFDEIYIAGQTYVPGTKLTVPPVKSLIAGDSTESNVLYLVSAVDPTTYALTLEPIYTKLSNDGYGLSSIVDYGNTMLRAYYDVRTLPYSIFFDRLYFYGSQPSTYQVVRYPNTANEAVVSLYYDASGTYIGNSVPMGRVAVNTNAWYCAPCNISFIPADDEELLVKVYNEAGALIATATVYAKASDLVNIALNYRPKIVSLSIDSTQLLTDGTGCYIYEKQSIDDLDITGILTYSDGTTREVIIDNKSTYLFGQEDFVAGYAGQVQRLMLRYKLSYNEVAVPSTTQGVSITDTSINREFVIKVVPNDKAVPIKLSAIPLWNPVQSAYVLHFFYYSTDHTKAIDVTSYVTVRTGTFVGNYYTDYQTFSAGLDMNAVDPKTYPTSAIYVQPFAIKLQPAAALVRYLITDAVSSTYLYGADSSASRRPVLYFDATRGQYFIPSTLFQNSQAVIASFYTSINPPYDSNTESTAPLPTHFNVRDANTGTLVTAEPVPLSNYADAFSLVSGSSSYVGGTVVVEFLQIAADGTIAILFGVPVDVYAGTYLGQ